MVGNWYNPNKMLTITIRGNMLEVASLTFMEVIPNRAGVQRVSLYGNESHLACYSDYSAGIEANEYEFYVWEMG